MTRDAASPHSRPASRDRPVIPLPRSAVVVLRLLALATTATRGQTVACIVQVDGPSTVRAAVAAHARLLADVIHPDHPLATQCNTGRRPNSVGLTNPGSSYGRRRRSDARKVAIQVGVHQTPSLALGAGKPITQSRTARGAGVLVRSETRGSSWALLAHLFCMDTSRARPDTFEPDFSLSELADRLHVTAQILRGLT